MRCNTDPAVQAFCSNEHSQSQEKKEAIAGISNTSDLVTLPHKVKEKALLEITDKTISDLSVRVKKLESISTREKEDAELLFFIKEETKELQSSLTKTNKPTHKSEKTLLEMTSKTMSVLSDQTKALEKLPFEDDEDAEFLLFIQKEQEELQAKLNKVKK